MGRGRSGRDGRELRAGKKWGWTDGATGRWTGDRNVFSRSVDWGSAHRNKLTLKTLLARFPSEYGEIV